jgi:hypothetical protein
MRNKTEIETGTEKKTRRAVVSVAAQVAVTAPAVGLLLSASTLPAAAQISPYNACCAHILDDFTFGSMNEDIDAIRTQSNFNPFNGKPNQDDVFVP